MMNRFLPFLAHGFNIEQFSHRKVLQDLESQVVREVSDDVKGRLGVLFKEEDLEADVSRHTC